MGLIAEIVRGDLGDCSNGGVSSRHTKVTLVNVDGPFEPTDDRPAAMLVKNHYNTARIVPAVEVDGEYVEERHAGGVGPMMGGTYVVTSDSRFSRAVEALLGHSFYGAVPFHDRFESQQQYEALSR